MRKWEDIVKDRLEGYESTLPEGSLAEFRALRNAGGTPKRKARPRVWASAIAVAAGLAAVLLLRHPWNPENSVQVISQPQVAQVQAYDSDDDSTIVTELPLLARAITPKPARLVSVQPIKEIIVEEVESEEVVETEPIEESVTLEETDEADTESPEPYISSPFVPIVKETKPVKMNIGTLAGTITGVGLLYAVPFVVGNPVSEKQYEDVDVGYVEPVENPGPVDYVTAPPRHDFPLIAGLSARIPIADRLSVTTGLEYSLYTSRYMYSISGEKKRLAHYLGIPLRLDWTFVSGRWLDCYVGAGVKGDYCVDATFTGKTLKQKDGPLFMLLGAGGLQFNATRHLGIYVEPEISWTIPFERQVLENYRSEHPYMFSVATGFRINFGK